MSKFTCVKNYHYLDVVEGNDGLLSLQVRKMFRNGEDKRFLYWESKGINKSELYISELEVFGVVISGHKLQQLTKELWVRGLSVNREGLCSIYTGKMGNDHAHYRLYDLFNWSKYGVTAPQSKGKFTTFISELPKYDHYEVDFSKSNSNDDWNVDTNHDESQVIKLDYDDLFISCKYGTDPILLWKIDSPSGAISTVELVGKINSFQMAKLEINGFALQGTKLTTLRDELLGRQVMVNRDGWCLFYTGDPTSNTRRGRGGYYNKVLPRFPWYKYGVTTSNSCIWGPIDYFDVAQPQPLTNFMFPLQANNGGCTNDGLKKELCSCKSILEDKDRELEDCKLQLKVKDTALRKKENKLEAFEKCLKEKGQELSQCTSWLEEMQKELEDFDEHLKERGHQELSQSRLQLEDKEKEFGDFEMLLKEKGQQLSQSQSQLEEKEKELNDCKSQLEEKSHELSQRSSQLEEKKKEVGLLEKSLLENGQELSQCMLLLEEKEKELSCFNKLLKDKDEQLTNIKLELQDKEEELCSYKNQLGEMENHLKESELQKKAREDDTSLCKSQLKKTEKELKDLDSQLQEIKKELANYMKRNKLLKMVAVIKEMLLNCIGLRKIKRL